MKLRKLFAWLMTLVMLLGMVPAAHAELAGCNHDWDSGKWLRGEPTNCLDWKPKTYTCTICGATATNEECGPCVPGSKTWIRPQGSNCQEYGVWEITCKYCGEWLEGMEEPGPHKWVTRTLEEPSCTISGWKSTECTYCGSEQGGPEEIPALGHDWSDWEWDFYPTCAMSGWQHRTCKRCRDREEKEIPPTDDHKWVETIEGASCEYPGWKESFCSVCGDEKGDGQEIPALGHDWGEWRWAHGSAPSCTEGAWQVRECQRCGRMEDRYVQGNDHQWSGWSTVSAGTCAAPAKEQRSCSVCGATETRDGAYGSHKWGEWKVTKQGNCVTNGEEQRTCSICGKTETRATGGGGHQFGDWFRSGIPTCIKEGLMRRNCSICGYYETEPIPMVDHTFGEWHTVILPAVGVEGLEERECSVCGLTEERKIPALEPETGKLEGGNNNFVNGEITNGKMELTLVLESTPANGKYFVLGEEVTFTETWVNNSDQKLYPFSVSIFTCAAPAYGSEVDQICSWFAEDYGGPVAPGATNSHTLTVTVTEADVARGAIYAMAELLSTVQDGPDLENVTTPWRR